MPMSIRIVREVVKTVKPSPTPRGYDSLILLGIPNK